MREADDIAAIDRPSEPRQVPDAAAWLGAFGLIPFVAGTLLILSSDAGWAYEALRFYAASILAFMGGVQWGLAMTAVGSTDGDGPVLWQRLSMSVLPALIAWLALLLDAPYDLLIIAVAFGLLLTSDLAAMKSGWAPAWYARLRIPLTTVVLICLVIAAWAWNPSVI